MVLGLPCNQFMGQEPGAEAEIQAFCQMNYGVTFPLTTKVDVRGNRSVPPPLPLRETALVVTKTRS